jgi:hypothetical protein
MTRIVRAEAEPLDPTSLARLQEVTRGVQEALQSTVGTRAGADNPDAVKALKEALRASQVPSPITVANRAVLAMKSGLLHMEDFAPTFAAPEIVLVGFDLKIEGVGLFKLDTSFGEGVALAEVSLAFNPLPPPTLIATLRASRSFDAEREEAIDSL